MREKPHAIVTTSWDDDARSGLKIAELLSAYRLPGTFYVPTGKLGGDSLLSADDLRNLSAAGFEIGGHTVSHAILTEVGQSELLREVSECKKTLEQILSREVTMFCYPKGRFNSAVMQAVQNAGYHGARTTQMLSHSSDVIPFAIPVTVQAYPHNRGNYIRSLLRTRAVGSLLKGTPELLNFQSWLQLGKHFFDRVLRDGGIWHLYGHPWEIERLDLWGQVRELFDYVGRRSDVEYLTNGDFVNFTQRGSGIAISRAQTTN